ncbi:MAG TPA: UDP-2,3-diacylglucosamine diphosphatase [Smithellaceae bacterium]|nr:UDP-2,3-diacylglucosamine diphosphatase [Smithellaceae bacterium]
MKHAEIVTMKAVFLSDAHLKCADDERYKRLERFFDDIRLGRIRQPDESAMREHQGPAIDHLFILGDFFDFWFCDKDHIHPEFRPMIDKLVSLQKSGVRVHLAEGNHDFFLAEYFRDVLGMTVYEEWATLEIDGLRLLIAHGDTVDQSDWFYLWFRRVLRSDLFYKAQRLLPSRVRWAIANFTSRASKEMNNDRNGALLNKMIAFASEKLKGDYDAIILGHCHHPALREFNVEGRKKTFIALGDWTRHYSYLYYEDGTFDLRCDESKAFCAFRK